MAALVPVLEAPSPGLLVARCEWPHQLLPEAQGEVLRRCLAESARGPVGLVFVLAERIREVPAAVRPFWRRALARPDLRVAAMAIVTASWCVEVEAMAFGVTAAMHGDGPRVAVFLEEEVGVEWARAAGARRPVSTPCRAG